MKFANRKITSNISLIYGFENDKPRYSLIATTHKKFDKTKIYGLLSRKTLKISDFVEFWRFLRKCIITKYIEFEVISSDARVYKTFLNPVKITKIKTFNNFEAEQLTILRKQKIKLLKD